MINRNISSDSFKLIPASELMSVEEANVISIMD